MRRSFVMPKLGLTMTEGLLAEWSLEPGARFERDQTVFVVETDKAANEVAAEAAGVLLEVVHPAGSTVAVGEVVGYWDDEDASAASPLPPPAQEAPDAAPAAPAAPGMLGTRAAPGTPAAQRIVATPLARREAGRRGIDLAAVRGSGPRGRIELADLPATPASASASASASAPASTAAAQPPAGRREQPDRIAAATARRLVQSKQEIPHFYLAREAEVGALIDLRQQLAGQAAARFTLNHFILAAVGRALLDEPSAARVWHEGDLLHLPGSDVGLAVHTERGLLVPVVRQAGARALADIARDAQAAAQRAREGRLQSADMAGAAITVSNAGMFDVTYMTPIINPGEAMILGVGSVRELFRPDRAGAPQLRREMGLVLACDHRVLDGVSGLRFLARVVHHLENPALLLVAPA